MASDKNKILTFQTAGLLNNLGTGPFYIRPTPLVSISRQSLRNEIGDFGGRYTITMTGAILDDKSLITNDGSVSQTNTPDDEAAFSIFSKQRDLKELFTQPDLYVEIMNVDGSETPDNVFQVKLDSLDFQEGTYVNVCRYTAVFTAEYMYDDNEVVHGYDIMAGMIESSDDNKTFTGQHPPAATVGQLRTTYGGLISDLSETWSIEVDENLSTTNDDTVNQNPDQPTAFIKSLRGYIVTRNVTILGKSYFDPQSKEMSPAWYEARGFGAKMVLTDLAQEYPGYAKNSKWAEGVLGLKDDFGGYNHVRTEEVDKANGTVTIVDTWVLCDDIAFENYQASIDFAEDSPYVSVTLNGEIQGITSIPASGEIYGGEKANGAGEEFAYRNALSKFHKVSNDGEYGVTCNMYSRANALTEMGLNPQPQSIALNENRFLGTISYSVTYDNRPTNIIKEALVENITLNDTYPGDLYSLIPVIGRPEGPILQYIGGRTEYRRDLSIELFFDYTDVNYTELDIRKRLVLSKPSINTKVKDDIRNLITECSPIKEPKIRKCFLNPPVENWNAKEGRYSLSLSWVYEIGEPLASASEQASIPIPGENNNLNSFDGSQGDFNSSPGSSIA